MMFGGTPCFSSGSTLLNGAPRMMLIEGGHAIALQRHAHRHVPAQGDELIERTRREWFEIHAGRAVDTEKYRVLSTCGIRNCVALEHAREVPRKLTPKKRKARTQRAADTRPSVQKVSRAEQKAATRAWVREQRSEA